MQRQFIILSLCIFAFLAAANGQQTIHYGFEQRVRNENWNNLFDFSQAGDDERSQIRWRTRLWMDTSVTHNFGIGVGLNQETNQIITPDRPFQFDEVVFETAYLDIKKLFVEGLALRVGRQNLIRGEGFILLEGTPWDGSRSVYQNAAVLSYTKNKSKLELMGILNPSRDRFLPRIHNQNRMLVEWDEQALGAYYTDKNLVNTSIEAYYFLKKELNDFRSPDHYQFNPGRRFHTVGGRVTHALSSKWSLTGEWALQWGRKRAYLDPDSGIDRQAQEIRGWGGYGYVKRAFGAGNQYYLQGGYWAMSGDDPDTAGTWEGWNPMFARWPKWSELYIYTQITEQGASYWTNTNMWQGEFGYAPLKWMKGRLTCYRMGAYHPFAANPAAFGNGTTRGNMYQARTDFKLRKYWSGHVVYERLAPGSFHANPDKAWFLRFEVIFHIEGSHEF